MKTNDNRSLASGAPSQAGDLDDRRQAPAAGTASADDERPDLGRGGDANPPGRDRSIDRGMASPGAASQAEASARHAAENLPQQDRTPKR